MSKQETRPVVDLFDGRFRLTVTKLREHGYYQSRYQYRILVVSESRSGTFESEVAIGIRYSVHDDYKALTDAARAGRDALRDVRRLFADTPNVVVA